MSGILFFIFASCHPLIQKSITGHGLDATFGGLLISFNSVCEQRLYHINVNLTSRKYIPCQYIRYSVQYERAHVAHTVINVMNKIEQIFFNALC